MSEAVENETVAELGRNVMRRGEFRSELQKLINRYSMEQYSDTQDFLLADYLLTCLYALETTLHERKRLSR
jgi:hypothetical protein